jgi:uncharacterized protein YerC
MVHLNRNDLDALQQQKLLAQLAKILNPTQTKKTHELISELLGQEEQIMVAKRLAVIILLSEELTAYKISRLLKLSESTVHKIEDRLHSGHYDHVLHTIGKTKKDYFQVLRAIDSILHLGGILPHYNGLDRYKYLK